MGVGRQDLADRGAVEDGGGQRCHWARGRRSPLPAEIARAAAGWPEGLPAIGLLDLYNPGEGSVLSITLFETEEDRRQGDATLSTMSPPPSGAAGRRVSVEMYEVPVKIDT